jgi:hypothetical protein
MRTRWGWGVRSGAWRTCLLVALACLSGSMTTLLADKPSRDDVQAAYLYNFGKFVRWPESRGLGPMLVCVAGQASLGQTIGKLVEGEQIDGHRLEERNLDRPEGVGACSILFVGSMERGREASFLAAAEGKPILTVSDAPDFLVRGGMIQFVQVEDHVRFSVNLEACSRHSVALSSELLKVAVTVTGKSGGTGGAR